RGIAVQRPDSLGRAVVAGADHLDIQGGPLRPARGIRRGDGRVRRGRLGGLGTTSARRGGRIRSTAPEPAQRQERQRASGGRQGSPGEWHGRLLKGGTRRLRFWGGA